MESTTKPNLELILIEGTVGMLLLTIAIVLFVYLFQRKLIKRKLAYQKIEDLLKHQELKSVYALMEGQDQERQRIATELHDDVGSMMVAINIYVDLLRKEKNEAEKQNLTEIISTLMRQATENVRKLSHRIDTSLAAYVGLKESLMALTNVINETKNLQLTFQYNSEVPLDKETTFNIYRIVQELLNNTLKHAQATHASIEITSANQEYISIIYEDNGVGIRQPEKKQGAGLNNIHLRVEKMNGNILQNPPHEKGFAMAIEIPRQA